MSKPPVLLALVLFFVTVSCASAEVTRLCEVCFHNGRAWSYPQVVPVTFATGSELNRSQNTNAFRYTEKYAVFPGAYGPEYSELKATIIGGSNSKFSAANFRTLFQVKGVTEAKGRSGLWQIRAQYPNLPQNRWIDPKEND